MEQVMALVSILPIVLALPVNNYTADVNFNSIIEKEVPLVPKKHRSLYVKIPQDASFDGQEMKDTLPEVPISTEKNARPSNRIGKIMLPRRSSFYQINSNATTCANFVPDTKTLILPMVDQPYAVYKVLVVTAPPNLKMSGEDGSKNFVIYVLFTDDHQNDTIVNIPTVYFVSKHSDFGGNKDKLEPIIVKPNRTVTGLKSNEIAKLVKFRTQKIIKKFDEFI